MHSSGETPDKLYVADGPSHICSGPFVLLKLESLNTIKLFPVLLKKVEVTAGPQGPRVASLSSKLVNPTSE